MSHGAIQMGLRVLAWGIPALWVLRVVEAARRLPGVADLNDAAYDGVPAGEPTVVVIVPARNEARDVGACLESLLAQDYAGVRVIAVNDRSEDGTGEVMASYAGERQGIQKIDVETLPAGWLGKTNAMAMAAELALAGDAPDYLLFTDADVMFRPDAVRRALYAAVEERADHFVLAPTTLIRRWDEAAFLAFFQIFGLWAARPWRVAEADARDAIGIGAFNLVRREAYLELGGFAALRMEIVEDLALARRVKAFGLRQRFAYGQGMIRLHWAAGVPGLVSVMTKNTFAATNYNPWLLMLGCVWIYFFCIGPFVTLMFHPLAWPALVTVAAMAWGYRLVGRMSGRSAWNVLLAPFAAGVMLFTLVRSMVVTLWQGGVVWRGTFYALGELRKNASPLGRGKGRDERWRLRF